MDEKADIYLCRGIGPVNRKLFHPLIKSVFRKCSYVSVRDEQSRQLLQTMGLDRELVEVVPDPVMGLSLPEASQPFEEITRDTALKTVGISVRYWEQSRKELDAIAQGLLIACGQVPLHLRFLPFHHSSDNEASRYVMQKLEEGIARCAAGSAFVKMRSIPGRCCAR